MSDLASTVTAATSASMAASAPPTGFSHFIAQQDAQAALHRWQAFVDAHLGQDGPSFVAAREALAQVTHELGRLLRDVGISPSVEGSAPGDNTAMQAAPSSSSRAARC